MATGPMKKLPKDDFISPDDQKRLGTEKGEGRREPGSGYPKENNAPSWAGVGIPVLKLSSLPSGRLSSDTIPSCLTSVATYA